MDPPPVKEVIVGSAINIDAGRAHVCALLADGTVSCWGLNDHGQLGNGYLSEREEWDTRKRQVVRDAVHVAAHADRSCAVTTQGLVQCWGNLRRHAFEPRLALPGSCNICACNSPEPRRVAGIDDAVAVTLGAEHGCALLRNGQVACWGDNRWGQLGLGHTRQLAAVSPEERELARVVDLIGVQQIAAGDYATCALLRDGTVRCWGANAEGQLGARTGKECGQESQDAGSSCSARPTLVRGLPPIAQIAVAPHHACARSRSGRVFCWGTNGQVQLGVYGPTTCQRRPYDSCSVSNHPIPVVCGASALEIPLPSPARLVVADAAATCAFFEEQRYSCWSRSESPRQWRRLDKKSWRVQSAVGSWLSGVLTEAGVLHLFVGDFFVPAVVSAGTIPIPGEPLRLEPDPPTRCARAQTPLPRCANFARGASEKLVFDESLVGKRIRVRGTLEQPPRADLSDVAQRSVTTILRDTENNYFMFSLRGGRQIACSGVDCCDVGGIGRAVVATGRLRVERRGTRYHLDDATLCQIAE